MKTIVQAIACMLALTITLTGEVMKVTSAVIPAAGRGTRFFPITKSIAKEMLPIVNKPGIQYVLEEGLQSGITSCTIVMNDEKTSIKHYLDKASNPSDDKSALDDLRSLTNTMSFNYVNQDQPRGLGHAIWVAHETITEDYFGVLLPDNLFVGPQPALKQLVEIAERENCSVVAVQEVAPEDVSRYGIISISKKLGPNLFEISDLVEKPKQDQAPSNYALLGRYVLPRKIFDILATTKPGVGNEIQLTDALQALIKNGERMLAVNVDGLQYDTGNPFGLLEANIAFAMQNKEHKAKIDRLFK